MLEKELTDLVERIIGNKCESNYIELKAAAKDCPEKLFDTLSSFSNQSGGGIIVFGIDEKNGYEICGVYDAADLQKKIMEQCNQMEPPVRPLCTVTRINGKTVVSAEIAEIDNLQKPCFYKGVGRLKGSYVRSADGDIHMTEYEVYSYEAFKKKIHDELRTDERSKLGDLKTIEMAKFMLALKSKKPNLARLSDERIMELQGFSNEKKPTLAGILLFSDYPQAFYPQLCVTAVSVPGTEMSATGGVGERFLDNKKIEGTIPQILDETLLFIRKNMKIKTIIDTNTGKRADMTEYPLVAVREIIVNALVHRDYSIHTDFSPVTVRMFADRIEVENPGGLYGRTTLDTLGKLTPDTRNPFIAGALEVLGETENRYSGIPTIRSEMKKAGLPEPLFENIHGVFKVTLYNALISSDLNDNERLLLEFCKSPRSRDEIAKLFNGTMTIAYAISTVVRPLIDRGKLGMTIPDKPKSKNQRYFTI